jgi:hypothetical protein
VKVEHPTDDVRAGKRFVDGAIRTQLARNAQGYIDDAAAYIQTLRDGKSCESDAPHISEVGCASYISHTANKLGCVPYKPIDREKVHTSACREQLSHTDFIAILPEEGSRFHEVPLEELDVARLCLRHGCAFVMALPRKVAQDEKRRIVLDRILESPDVKTVIVNIKDPQNQRVSEAKVVTNNFEIAKAIHLRRTTWGRLRHDLGKWSIHAFAQDWFNRDTVFAAGEYNELQDERPGNEKKVLKAIRRAHDNLGHPSNNDLVRMLRAGGASEYALSIARNLKCSICQEDGGTKSHGPAKVPRA